jgi:hypothetical protein
MGLSKEEFEARRLARRSAGASDEARDEQMSKDREAIDTLETEHGYVLDVSLSVKHFVPGHPVIIGVRPPKGAEYKRYFQQINRANAGPDAKGAAHETLAQTCWAYPSEPESRKVLIDSNPALLAQVGNIANKLAELEREDEGKD